jgi:hypothetical protein
MIALEELSQLGQGRVTINDWIKAGSGDTGLGEKFKALKIQKIGPDGKPMVDATGAPIYLDETGSDAVNSFLEGIADPIKFGQWLKDNNLSLLDLTGVDAQKQISDLLNAQLAGFGGTAQFSGVVDEFLKSAASNIKASAIITDIPGITSDDVAAALSFGDVKYTKEQIDAMSAVELQNAVAQAAANYGKDVATYESILSDQFASPAMKEQAQANLVRAGATGQFATAHSFKRMSEELQAADDITVGGTTYSSLAEVLKDEKVSRFISDAFMSDEQVKDSPALKKQRDDAVKWLTDAGIWSTIQKYSSEFKTAVDQLNPTLKTKWENATKIVDAVSKDLGLEDATVAKLLNDDKWRTTLSQYATPEEALAKNPTIKLLSDLKKGGNTFVQQYADTIDVMVANGDFFNFSRLADESALQSMLRGYPNWKRQNDLYKLINSNGGKITDAVLAAMPADTAATIKFLRGMGIDDSAMSDDIVKGLASASSIESAVFGDFEDFTGMKPFKIQLYPGQVDQLIKAAEGTNELIDMSMLDVGFKGKSIQKHNTKVQNNNFNAVLNSFGANADWWKQRENTDIMNIASRKELDQYVADMRSFAEKLPVEIAKVSADEKKYPPGTLDRLRALEKKVNSIDADYEKAKGIVEKTEEARRVQEEKANKAAAKRQLQIDEFTKLYKARVNDPATKDEFAAAVLGGGSRAPGAPKVRWSQLTKKQQEGFAEWLSQVVQSGIDSRNKPGGVTTTSGVSTTPSAVLAAGGPSYSGPSPGAGGHK